MLCFCLCNEVTPMADGSKSGGIKYEAESQEEILFVGLAKMCEIYELVRRD